MQTRVIYPPNLGWLETKLNKDALDHINKCTKAPLKNFKQQLAGVISESYEIIDLDNWFYNNVLIDLCNLYAINFKNLAIDVPVLTHHPLYLSSMWINYQKEHEFNPRHTHTQSVYSFVIWLKIPTKYSEQKELNIAKNVRSTAISNFSFDYQNILGGSGTYNYFMDPNLEGSMIFFPSTLNHTVYPFFNCKENRVTVSGNISVNTTKTIK